MDLVVVESPFAGEIEKNVAYARACVMDCLRRGEAPYASHLFYTQPGVLDDTIPGERKLGIEAGFAWGMAAKRTVIYIDRGLSTGMKFGIEAAYKAGRSIEVRSLFARAKITGSPPNAELLDELAIAAAADAVHTLIEQYEQSNESDTRSSVESVINEVRAEMLRAESKFAKFNSRHEAYAVLLEEVDELWDEVKTNQHARAREEAVQVGAMALRFLRDF